MRHRHYGKTLGILTLALTARSALAAEPYKPNPGPYAVTSLLAEWKDHARPGGAVSMPVKLYYPKTIADVKGPLPLIIFSHGLGGSREGYSMWAEQWASQGYIVVLPTHAGSDTLAVAAALLAPDAAKTAVNTVINAQTAMRRVQDVSFAITHMEGANAGTLDDKALDAFKGKVDVKHIGMAGHSFGAATSLMIAGQSEILLAGLSFSDPRVSSALAMSPQPATRGDQKTAFGGIKIPVFHMTGTLDDAPLNLGNVKAADRRVPFDNSPLPETYLVIFKGATHMTFSARALNPTAAETKIYSLIMQSTTAFWDATLKDDAKAKAWLENDFAPVLGAAGTWERKKKK